MAKKVIYVDMDGVMCNFKLAKEEALMKEPSQQYPQSKYGFYCFLQRIETFDVNALYYLEKLGFEVNILTRPSVKNLNCYSDKAAWVFNHLGQHFVDRLYMAPDKSKLIGDYLIDDDTWENFMGTVIQYGTKPYYEWQDVIKFFEKESERIKHQENQPKF